MNMRGAAMVKGLDAGPGRAASGGASAGEVLARNRSRRDTAPAKGRLRRAWGLWLAVAFVAFAGFAVPSGADAQDRRLVRSADSETGHVDDFRDRDHAQRFRTGNHPHGYLLKSIEIRVTN